MIHAHTRGKTLQWFALADADVVLYAATVTVWGRWFVWLFGAVMLAYRPGLWYPEDIEYVLLNVMLAAVNGVFHYRLLTNRPVTWRWMVGLSAMDIALITANIAVSGRFASYIFLTYYPALGAIAVIFTSFRLNGWRRDQGPEAGAREERPMGDPGHAGRGRTGDHRATRDHGLHGRGSHLHAGPQASFQQASDHRPGTRRVGQG